MTSAAIYARVSTVRQAERDLSLPDQIARCRADRERQGWERKTAHRVSCRPAAAQEGISGDGIVDLYFDRPGIDL